MRSKPDALLGFMALVIPYAIGVILLSNYPAGGDVGYAAMTFFSILFASLIFSWIAQRFNHNIRWFDSPDKHDWLYLVLFPIKSAGKTVFYLPFGVLALVLAAFFIAPIVPGSVGILMALGVGGIVLSYQLYKTESVFIPWISHWLYNLLAVVMAHYSVVPLSASPIFVPSLSFDGASLEILGKEAAFQLIAVSLSEEMMRVSLAIGAALLITKDKKIAFVVAVILWTLLHTILSYKIPL